MKINYYKVPIALSVVLLLITKEVMEFPINFIFICVSGLLLGLLCFEKEQGDCS
jgi:hypothetical protein